MDYSTRSRPLQRIEPDAGKWICYQLRLAGKTQRMVAAYAGLDTRTVSAVLNGNRSSARVYNALTLALGYRTFSELLAAARRSVA